jgi:two-component system CheB/CheR fusion protein
VADHEPDEEFEALLRFLRDDRGVDFTGYKRPSLTRLVNRRMRAAGVEDYRAFIDLLQVQPRELKSLLDALLINVTAFFRDPQAWDELRHVLLPTVLAELHPDEQVRVWSAACATGEEAYSLAILLHEMLGDDEFRARVKIYATDVDDDALTVARTGRYSEKALENLSEEQRQVYFEREGVSYRFRPDLRTSIIFGRHDLLQDAPISRVVLLSCRNALMYFTPETQTRVLERFAFALHEHGLMLLGKAEMLLTQSQLFTPISLQHRIFRARRRTPAARLAALAVGGDHTVTSSVSRAAEAAFVAAPAAQVVLDGHGIVTLLNERAQRDLRLTTDDLGKVFFELELSSRPIELRGAVAGAQASRQPVQLREMEWPQPGGGVSRWDVRVAPLDDGEDVIGIHLVFEDVTERVELRTRLQQVHNELSTAYEELQSSSEELETTNEELQSAVEELETTNEELQSTNEELETMNEELQSTNEELQTLNDELRDRTLQVDEANGFLHSILEGLDQAVIVVDGDLRVQLWNSGVERLTGLRSFEAEGLRLTDLALGVPAEQVRLALLEVVLDGGASRSVEEIVTTRFGEPAMRRLQVTPLRRSGGPISGAVMRVEDAPIAP